MRAGDRDALAEAHELAQHFGAPHDRYARRLRREQLRDCPAATAEDTTTTLAPATCAAAWPTKMRTPIFARRAVTAFARRSEPCTA